MAEKTLTPSFGITTYSNLKINFWGITKCGNTKVRVHLWELETGGPLKNPGIAINRKLKFLTREQAKNNGRFNFTVTRHPYERVMSMWKDLKYTRKSRGQKAGLKNIENILDFLKFLSDNDDENLDTHFKSMSWYIPDDIPRCDLREITTDAWPAPCKKPNEIKVHQSRTDIPIILTDEMKGLIFERYKKDFERFGYESY